MTQVLRVSVAGASALLVMMAAAGCGSGSGGGAGVAGSGAGAAGAGGGAAGAAGAAGGPATGALGIVATIGTVVTEFRNDPFAYGGRPPLLEIWALSDISGTFRIVVVPENGETIVPGATYVCRTGRTYMTLMSGRQYDTYMRSGGSCSVTVTEAGPDAGARFAGTFSGTLIAPDDSQIVVTNGSFLGVLTL